MKLTQEQQKQQSRVKGNLLAQCKEILNLYMDAGKERPIISVWCSAEWCSTLGNRLYIDVKLQWSLVSIEVYKINNMTGLPIIAISLRGKLP